jgi:hypothetical protein
LPEFASAIDLLLRQLSREVRREDMDFAVSSRKVTLMWLIDDVEVTLKMPGT